MRDPRLRSDNAVWLSKGQLGALTVTAAAVAVLTFFIGLTLGQRPAVETVVVASPDAEHVLIEEGVRDDGLAVLLARVEMAAGVPVAQASLSYPERLLADAPVVEVPEAPEPEVLVPAEVLPVVSDAPLAPDDVVDEPVGWAVQLFSETDSATADARVAELVEAGVSAYRVDVLLGGKTHHRVRVGPFASEAKAQDAVAELAAQSGSPSPSVARAQ
jgi:cell division septation protein DedD